MFRNSSPNFDERELFSVSGTDGSIYWWQSNREYYLIDYTDWEGNSWFNRTIREFTGCQCNCSQTSRPMVEPRLSGFRLSDHRRPKSDEMIIKSKLQKCYSPRSLQSLNPFLRPLCEKVCRNKYSQESQKMAYYPKD